MLHLDGIESCIADSIVLHMHNVAWHQHLLDYSFGRYKHIATVFYNTVQVKDRIVSNA